MGQCCSNKARWIGFIAKRDGIFHFPIFLLSHHLKLLRCTGRNSWLPLSSDLLIRRMRLLFRCSDSGSWWVRAEKFARSNAITSITSFFHCLASLPLCHWDDVAIIWNFRRFLQSYVLLSPTAHDVIIVYCVHAGARVYCQFKYA